MHLVYIRTAGAQVMQDAVSDAEYPAMDFQLLTTFPCILDNVGMTDIGDLFNDIEFAQTVQLLFPVSQFVQLLLVLPINILDPAYPVINQAMFLAVNGRPDTATTVMTTDNNVLDFQDINGILQHGQAVQIGVNNKVGDIAVDEHLTR